MIELRSMITEPWAITEEAMGHLVREAMGETPSVKTEPSAIMENSMTVDDSKQAPYSMEGDVAVLPVIGSLIKREPQWAWGRYASYEGLRKSIEQALDDNRVSAILLNIDSPGGLVDGVKELADWIFSIRDQKPIHALADGCMCSAAFYLGAATGRVHASSPLCRVGSIGVLQLHTDWSGFNEQAGLKPTWMHAGRFKAMGNPDEPLNTESSNYLQERLDTSYQIFVSDIARYLGLDLKEASAWADGQFFQAQVGLELGLVHGIMTRPELIASIQEDAMTKTAAQLRSEHPEAVMEIVQSIQTEERAKAEKDRAEAVEAARAEGVGSAIDLCGAVLGEEARTRLEPVIKSGITPDQLKAVGFTPEDAAEKEDGRTRAEILDRLRAADPVGVEPGSGNLPDREKATEQQAVIDRMAAVEV